MLLALIVLPLLGFFINGAIHLFSIKTNKKGLVPYTGWIATACMVLAFFSALYTWISFQQMGGNQAIVLNLFRWMKLGALSVDFSLVFDSLSAVFCLVITGVGSLIHLYSVEYMSRDEGRARYFSYLNLFCFMMLNLVLGATLPHVFLGWEGVGLASYLLIGFWHQDAEKVVAGQKAFVMNRIGDLGFLLAMFIAFKFAGTLDLSGLQHGVFSPRVAMVFGLLIFFACTGKSAQFPLFTWLPDAMAGPTPVSALIHAATMVTSGIYLLARLHGVIADSALTMSVISGVGAVTAFLAAINACTQSDIKKILAYSTISQLGFMFVACGVGSFSGGVFHVMTHAFFKALLFLGAGSVIHALHEEQNIFKMGGLRKALPITFFTFAAGWAAILGLPPFSGFFSKDEIILEAYASPHSNPFVFYILLCSALLTAFYMTRLLILTFFGETRMPEEKRAHVHESPWIMAGPLAILGALSFVGGWFGPPVHLEPAPEHHQKGLIMVISVAVAALGAWFAYYRYWNHTKEEKTRDLLGLDWVYGLVFGKGVSKISEIAYQWVEEALVQRAIRFTGAFVGLSGNIIKVVQNGSAQAYLLMIVLSAIALVAWILKGAAGYGKL